MTASPAAPASAFPSAASAATPSIRRRLACIVYEALLVFGVVAISDALFDIATQSRHALMLRTARQLFLFLVIGVYFCFCWCRHGQTLAMQTWRIRLVSASGGRVHLPAAMLRYVLAWMWFVPAMAIDHALGLKGWPSIAVIALGMLAWLGTTRLDASGQFLHDRLAGTRLICLPKKPA